MRLFLVFVLLSCSSSDESKQPGTKPHEAKIDELEKHLKDQFKTEKEKVEKKENLVSSLDVGKKQEIAEKSKKAELDNHQASPVVINNPKVKLTKKGLSKTDKRSKKFWSLFDPKYIYIGEESVISATYLGVHAGDLTLKVRPKAKVGGKDAYYFFARAQSAKFYNWVYEIDDVVESFVTVKEFLPLKYALSQRESKKTVDHIELYDRSRKKTFFRYKKVKGGETTFKKEDKEIPYFSQDYLSCFFFIKGMPLRKGDIYLVPTTTKGKTWTLRAEVLKREKIRLSAHGHFKAVKLKIVTKYDGEIAKQGNIFLWVSDDRYRKILKFKSEFKIGAITGELQSYSLGGKKIL